MGFWAHFITVTKHRHKVMLHCFKVGIPLRGLLHDLSKYSLTEFIPGAKYYQGDRSPNERERELLGYSQAWLHHKGRNKHHFEYWYDVNPESKLYEPVEMPVIYTAEMFCDRVAASKIYRGKEYNDDYPLLYFKRGHAARYMHENTARRIERWLTVLSESGEDAAFHLVKGEVRAAKANKKDRR